MINVLILGFLSLLLISCGSTPQVIKPDGALTVDMDRPVLEGNLWKDLAEAYIRGLEAIDEGNSRFKAIRE